MAKKDAGKETGKEMKKIVTLSDVKAEFARHEAKMAKHYNSDDVDKQNALIAKIKAMSESKKEA